MLRANSVQPRVPCLDFCQVRWASKKAMGTSKNGRDSNPKYLGVKKFGGHLVKPGNIIVRQRGTRIRAGHNVSVGKDHTLHSLVYGFVKFGRGKLQAERRHTTYVHVQPVDIDPEILHDLNAKSCPRTTVVMLEKQKLAAQQKVAEKQMEMEKKRSGAKMKM